MTDKDYSNDKGTNAERWYNSAFGKSLGKGIGLGAIYFGLFAGIGCTLKGCDYQGSSYQVEYKRLDAVEEALRQNPGVPLKDISDFLKENNLDGNK